MFAALNGSGKTKMSYHCRYMCTSFSRPTMCMFAIIGAILLTGVMTSVSLYALFVVLLLVIVLVVLLSLLLIGLTRLVRLEGLVGLIKETATRIAQGV